MGFYTDVRSKDVLPLIEEFGAAVTIREVVDGAYDPTTGVKAADTTTDYPIKGVFKEYTSGAIDGSIVMQGDKILLLPGTLPVEPKPGFRVISNGETWRVPVDSPGAVKTIAPGGVPVVYVLRLRQ